MKRSRALAAVAATILLAAPPPADAEIVRGLAKMLYGIVALPVGILTGTASGPPILGTAAGAVSGAWTGARFLASGAWDLAASGVAVAKMAAPFVLPFIF